MDKADGVTMKRGLRGTKKAPQGFAETGTDGREKRVRRDDDIFTAVKAWQDDKNAAEKKYGAIGEWDTSKVTTLCRLFGDMTHFNKDISRWNVANVTTMHEMFWGASSFNQPRSSGT